MDFDKIILNFLQKYPNLNEESILSVLQISNHLHLKQNEDFIKIDETHNKLGFITNGIVRGYTIKEDGTELSLMFLDEWNLIGNFEMILYNKPATIIFEALEPTDIIVFPFEKIEQLRKESDFIDKTYHKIIFDLMAKMLKIMMSYMNEKPEARYKKILNSKHNLYNRISQKHLASFLGITPVSLSRLRNRISKGN